MPFEQYDLKQEDKQWLLRVRVMVFNATFNTKIVAVTKYRNLWQNILHVKISKSNMYVNFYMLYTF
jgi:hypothetical protein